MRWMKTQAEAAGSQPIVILPGPQLPKVARRLSTLSLAVTAALAVMAASPAQADAPIVGAKPGGHTWLTGDLTVGPAANVSGGSSGVYTGSSSLGTLSNSGFLQGSYAGIYNDGNAITAISNASGASITGGNFGVASDRGSVIGTLVNSGTIQAVANGFGGVMNMGTITTLTNNSGGLMAGGNSNAGLQNTTGGRIGVLTNSGMIRGGTSPNGNFSHGVDNSNGSTITTLNNTSSGTISGAYSGVYNYSGSGTALITELNNSGLISGNVAGVYNDTRGRIATLNNLAGGVINGGVTNEATITVLNNAGLISGTNAILITSGGTITTLTNSGTIAGNIINSSNRVQNISGGSGSVFGTLTGLNGSIGLITNTRSNWVFNGGNQILNSNINVGSNTVLNSAGVLQLNNQISVTGNYQQSVGATLNIGVGSSAIANGSNSDSGYGRLLVSGSAVLDAGSSVALKKNGSYRFANGQRYLVIQAAAAGSNYNEATLRYRADGYRGDITGSTVLDGANLGLLLTLDGEIVNPANEVNARRVLDSLYQYTGTNAALMNLFNAAAALATPEDANRAGSQLDAASLTSGIAGSADTVGRHLNGVIFERLNGGTQGASGLSGGDATNAGDGNRAAWGQAFGGKASAGARDGISGYHASYNGLLLGADTALNDQWRVGGLFNYASTSVSNDGNNAGSYARVDAYGLSTYASYQGEPWYLNTAFSAIRSDIHAHRLLDFSGFSATASSSYKGMQYIAAVRAGYPLSINDVVLTPLAGLTYSSLRLDAYSESGGNGAALRVGAADTHSLKSDIGFKLERDYKTSYGVLKPMAQLLWRHEYSDTRLQSVANFAADVSGATSFVTQGARPVRDTAVLSLGATLLRSDKLTLSTAYTLEKGGGYQSQTGSLTARWRF